MLIKLNNFKGKKVIITGHTGFKGSWLSLWLYSLNAKIRGISNSNRETLVGIFPKKNSETFDAGTIICENNNIKGFGIGRVTSVTHSPELGHWIGLGFIKGGFTKWQNRTVVGSDPVRNKQMDIKVVSPHMIDPEGKRMYA